MGSEKWASLCGAFVAEQRGRSEHTGWSRIQYVAIDHAFQRRHAVVVHGESCFAYSSLTDNLQLHQPIAIDERDDDGHTALMWAAYQGEYGHCFPD